MRFAKDWKWWAAAMALAALAMALTTAGCGSRGTASEGYDDPHPLPADAMVTTAPEVGTYGGRFVIAQTTGPKTFNAIMANETSSSDITQILFCTLAEFDNGTQQTFPYLAK